MVNTTFNPFDYVSGKSFRALLDRDYLSLVQELHEKVSADRFSFALEVGNFFYRAVYSERKIMMAMVCASGLPLSDALTSEENALVQEVQALLNLNSFEKTKRAKTLTEEVKEIASAIAVVYFQTINEYCLRINRDSLGWGCHFIQAFFKKWYAFSNRIAPAKYSWQLYELIEKLAEQEGYDNPGSDLNRDIYDIEAPSEEIADEIVQIARTAGFQFGMTKAWQGRLQVPKHFRLKSFAWQKSKLLRLVQLVAWHYPDAKIELISPLSKEIQGYYWYRDELHVSEKLRIYARMSVNDLLKKTNFEDPWSKLRECALRR